MRRPKALQSHWARHSIWFSLRKASKRTLKVTGKCWTWSGLPCWHQWAITEHPIPDQKTGLAMWITSFYDKSKTSNESKHNRFQAYKRPLAKVLLFLDWGLKPQPSSPWKSYTGDVTNQLHLALTYWQQLDLPTQQKKINANGAHSYFQICKNLVVIHIYYVYISHDIITCQNVSTWGPRCLCNGAPWTGLNVAELRPAKRYPRHLWMTYPATNC